MKKTIVALAVAALAATSANAAVVYNQDGTKVEVKGSVRLLLQKETDKRTDLVDNSSRLEFAASQELGNDLSALGYARLNLTDKSFSDSQIKLDKAYAGFAFDGVGQLTFGKQATNGGDLGVANYTYALGDVNKVVDDGNKVVHFTSADFGGFKFGVDYVFATKSEKNELNDRAVVLAAFFDRKFGDVGVKFGTGLSNAKVDKAFSRKAYTVASEVSFGPVALGVDYSTAKGTKAEKTQKEKALLVGVKYQVTDMVKVYTNYEVQRTDKMGKFDEKTREFALGAGYNLHKNVETFLEGAKRKTTKANMNKATSNNIVQVGLRVHF
ncbi:porin [[Haemophilus] felis]|nr:porin [[Haemophilus] felis]